MEDSDAPAGRRARLRDLLTTLGSTADVQACLDEVTATIADVLLVDVAIRLAEREQPAPAYAPKQSASRPLTAGEATGRGVSVPLVAQGEMLGCLDVLADPDEISETTALLIDLLAAALADALWRQRSEEVGGLEVSMRLSEERFRLAFDSAPVGMIEVGETADGLVVRRVNHQAGRLCGVDVVAAQEHSIDEVVVVTEGVSLGQRLTELIEGDQKEAQTELRIRSGNGTKSWVLAKIGLLPAVAGHAGLLCQLVDINESKVGEAELTRQAHYDALTGLPNRRLALARLRDVVTTARVSGESGALLFCDLDNFKTVNDEFGHLVGDEALVELARRLNSAVRKSDVAGRFGGDEFVIVASPVTVQETRALAERVREAMSAPMMLNGTPCVVSLSIGVTMVTGEHDVVEVLRQADQAMYEARRRARLTTYVVDSA